MERRSLQEENLPKPSLADIRQCISTDKMLSQQHIDQLSHIAAWKATIIESIKLVWHTINNNTGDLSLRGIKLTMPMIAHLKARDITLLHQIDKADVRLNSFVKIKISATNNTKLDKTLKLNVYPQRVVSEVAATQAVGSIDDLDLTTYHSISWVGKLHNIQLPKLAASEIASHEIIVTFHEKGRYKFISNCLDVNSKTLYWCSSPLEISM